MISHFTQDNGIIVSNETHNFRTQNLLELEFRTKNIIFKRVDQMYQLVLMIIEPFYKRSNQYLKKLLN